jgi:hypothetical protein
MFILILFISFFSLSSQALESYDLQRINFLPETTSYADLSYRYSFRSIEAPTSQINTKELKETANLINFTYGHKVQPRTLLGLNLAYEESSESGVRYGVATSRRFSSQGLVNPELFVIHRLRSQKKTRGLIDLKALFSKGMHRREIGTNTASQFQSRDNFSLALSHGLLENQWEFRSSLKFSYFGEGAEKNVFTNSKAELGPYAEYLFDFTTQYEISSQWYVNAMAGFLYRSSQNIQEDNGLNRELQAGTGSIFGVGAKYLMASATVISLDYSVYRNDYFVLSSINFDGDELAQTIEIKLTRGF